jgi:hypothetical protein
VSVVVTVTLPQGRQVNQFRLGGEAAEAPVDDIPAVGRQGVDRARPRANLQARLRSHAEQLVIVHHAIESNTPDEGQSRHGLPGR